MVVPPPRFETHTLRAEMGERLSYLRVQVALADPWPCPRADERANTCARAPPIRNGGTGMLGVVEAKIGAITSSYTC